MNKLTKLINVVMPYVRGLVIGMLLPIGVWNIIDGNWMSNNSWQFTAGVFQLLYAVALFQQKP